jgi:outer membrane protein assembly factor BamB
MLACGFSVSLCLLIAGCGSAVTSAPAAISAQKKPQETVSEQTAAPAQEKAAADSTAHNSEAGKDWPVFRGDALATGIAESTLPENLEVLWKFNSNTHGFEATVAIVDGLVFAGSLDGELYVLSLADGSLKWKHHTELGFNAPPGVANGRVFAGDADGRFYCLEAATGKPLWGYESGAEIDSGPNFYKDWVLFGSQDATLYCLEQATGKLVWKYTIGDQVRCSPTIVEGRAFLAGCDAKLHIIDLDKGEAITRSRSTGPLVRRRRWAATACSLAPKAPAFFASIGAKPRSCGS